MKFIVKFFFAALIFFPCSSIAQKNIRLSSPDGTIVFSFKLINQSAFYSVAYRGKTVIANSSLSLKFSDGDFAGNLRVLNPIFGEADEKYELVVGKTKTVSEHYMEVTIPLQQTVTPNRKINLTVKAFNDGIAFRYNFPDEQNKHSFILTDEKNVFNFSANTLVRTLFLPSYTSSHEGPYHTLPISNVKEDTLMDLPTLFETPEHIFVGITESNLLDYAGMYLIKEHGVIRSKLSPLPGQTEIKVKANLPHHSPWRVLLISDRVGALIESNIITDLAEPCRIKDVSWIKPGKTTFPWWNGNVVPDTINAPGNNFVTNKYYIDFCARNHIEYHSVVEYGLHEWYTSDGAGFVPGPNADVTKPVPGLDMKEICDYAKSKGVGIRVWVYWTALYKKLDAAFDQFEKWGLQGMMVDFLDRDDQEMVNKQTEILEKAAAHHLHIQFHGAYRPTGLNRTYPNEYTREGTRNYEVNKWGPGLTADHDIYMPFTRMLGGSTDYHLGGFRAVPDSLYVAQYTRPLMLGTRCHMLAMYVVLENYLGMVCDYPAAYEGQPGFEFIKEVPTVWDETKVPSAKVEEYVAIARRHLDDWYIGSINNHEARQITIPLNFLGDGDYDAEIYTDASDVRTNPNNLVKQIKNFKKTDNITLQLASGGGAVVRLIKK
jgi:alpha-glucosidase